MSRPAVPIETRREVLFEARHRCCVCCEPLALELAHVVPWSESKDHAAENLIALCANCHTRADKEKWGREFLRKYKSQPCALVSNSLPPFSSSQKVLIDVILSADPDELNEKERRRLVAMIAAYLNIRIDVVDIVAVTPTNSSKVTFTMPLMSANHLLEGFTRSDPRLNAMLEKFEVLGVVFEPERLRKPAKFEPQHTEFKVGPVGTGAVDFYIQQNGIVGTVYWESQHGFAKASSIMIHFSVWDQRNQVLFQSETTRIAASGRSGAEEFVVVIPREILDAAGNVTASVIFSG